MATPKPKKDNRVQLRVFTAKDGQFTERQVFKSRLTALAYLTMATGSPGGLLLNHPHEGGVEAGDRDYAVLIPWHRIYEVDIIRYVEEEGG